MARQPSAVAITPESEGKKDAKKRYFRKNFLFFNLVEKLKLWPSRTGILHGVKSVEINGKIATITTHCGETFTVWDSRTSRAARWLRNKWCASSCSRCKVPQWKLEKYSATMMTQKWGARL